MSDAVKIIWDDAGSFSEENNESPWRTVDQIKEEFAIGNFINSTYGEIVFETESDLIIAQNVMVPNEGHEVQYSNYIRIPKAMVVTVIKLGMKQSKDK